MRHDAHILVFLLLVILHLGTAFCFSMMPCIQLSTILSIVAETNCIGEPSLSVRAKLLEHVGGGQVFQYTTDGGFCLLATRWRLAQRCVSMKSNTNAGAGMGGTDE